MDFEELARETGSASVASAGVRFGQIMRQFNEEFAEGKYDDVRQPSRVKRAADAAASAGNNVSGAKVVTGDEPVPKKARRTKKDAVETKEAYVLFRFKVLFLRCAADADIEPGWTTP